MPCAAHPFNRLGKASGELIGGNLSLIVQIGTKTAFQTKNKILFIEDLDEYIYQYRPHVSTIKKSWIVRRISRLGHWRIYRYERYYRCIGNDGI
jgi:muramoyltetrapeptide carboxypeptidase